MPRNHLVTNSTLAVALAFAGAAAAQPAVSVVIDPGPAGIIGTDSLEEFDSLSLGRIDVGSLTLGRVEIAFPAGKSVRLNNYYDAFGGSFIDSSGWGYMSQFGGDGLRNWVADIQYTLLDSAGTVVYDGVILDEIIALYTHGFGYYDIPDGVEFSSIVLEIANPQVGPVDASATMTFGFSGVITVLESPACPADTNGDGILDNGDINAFVQLFLAGDPAADFNGDGFLDNGDINAFVVAFLAGC